MGVVPDGRIDRTAFESAVRELEPAQLPLEDLETPLFGSLQLFHIRLRSGVDAAKLHQQVAGIALELRPVCPGEDRARQG